MKVSNRARIAAAFGAALACATVFSAGAKLARTAVQLDRLIERPVRVLKVTGGDRPRVWLTGAGTKARGRHSLLFDSQFTDDGRVNEEASGHARIGKIVSRDGDAVVRELLGVDRRTLSAGQTGRMVGWWYASPDELGYRVEDVTYETELGPMDAWIVRPRFPRKKRWAIHTHGRGASAPETFRGIAPLARAGVTSLIIRYRNDVGAPAGHAGRYGLGLSESRDVDAAIAYAVSRGAERVTLVGWSMGGSASLVSATSGPHRHLIDGIVLDSPGVDWGELLRAHAKIKHAPTWLANVGMALLSSGIIKSGEPDGIDFEVLRPEHFASRLEVPVLVLASPNDVYVPWDGAKKLAALRPDLVQFVSIPHAGHVRLWNVDPEKWEQSVLTFVSALPKPAWRGQ